MALTNLLADDVPAVGTRAAVVAEEVLRRPPTPAGRAHLSIRQLCSPAADVVPITHSESDAISSSESDTLPHMSMNINLKLPEDRFPATMMPSPAARMCRHEARVKKPWTHAEDELLRALVAQMGVGMWACIAQHIPDRSGKQVRERWLNHLSPTVTKLPWSPEEDRLILETHVQYGNAWSKIARLLKGRSDNSVKNRFYTTLKRRYVQPAASSQDIATLGSPTSVDFSAHRSLGYLGKREHEETFSEEEYVYKRPRH
jgi:hypothetical protein